VGPSELTTHKSPRRASISSAAISPKPDVCAPARFATCCENSSTTASFRLSRLPTTKRRETASYARPAGVNGAVLKRSGSRADEIAAEPAAARGGFGVASGASFEGPGGAVGGPEALPEGADGSLTGIASSVGFDAASMLDGERSGAVSGGSLATRGGALISGASAFNDFAFK
jgi:hypothetical protein